MTKRVDAASRWIAASPEVYGAFTEPDAIERRPRSTLAPAPRT
jgi:hypothetical protein